VNTVVGSTFTVTFTTYNQSWAVGLSPYDIGWEILTKIKEELSLKIPIYKIELDFTRLYEREIVIPITDTQAREFPYFRVRNNMAVMVPPRALNRFIVWRRRKGWSWSKFKTNRNKVFPVLDKNLLWSTWKADGAPQTWLFDDKNAESDLLNFIFMSVGTTLNHVKGATPHSCMPFTYLKHPETLMGVLPITPHYIKALLSSFCSWGLAAELGEIIYKLYTNPGAYSSVTKLCELCDKLKDNNNTEVC